MKRLFNEACAASKSAFLITFGQPIGFFSSRQKIPLSAHGPGHHHHDGDEAHRPGAHVHDRIGETVSRSCLYAARAGDRTTRAKQGKHDDGIHRNLVGENPAVRVVELEARRHRTRCIDEQREEDSVTMDPASRYPDTPDGRYFVVRGRLWRKSNPALDDDARERLVKELMSARRAVRGGKSRPSEMAKARQRVNEAKTALGERGPVWWDDGAPDFNRHLVKNTPYAVWFERLPG